MIEIRRILCPTDFSDFSRHAFDHAVALARYYEATITLLHVSHFVPVTAQVHGGVVVPAVALAAADRTVLLADMRHFADREAGGAVPVDLDVVQGTPVTEILAKVNDLRADLIVMGTHGRSGFERFVLGSVTEKVLRKATCPVLTVPSGMPDAVPAPPVLFKRILCAVDFSDCSLRALEYAISLAQESDAHLTLVHVIELPTDIAREVHENVAGPPNLREYVPLAEKDRLAQLEAAVPDGARTFCTVETLVATGRPYREILRVADAQRSELLVVGVHGRGTLDRFFFGCRVSRLTSLWSSIARMIVEATTTIRPQASSPIGSTRRTSCAGAKYRAPTWISSAVAVAMKRNGFENGLRLNADT
jgi:nucleotide-binding universal stress UspA family protein